MEGVQQLSTVVVLSDKNVECAGFSGNLPINSRLKIYKDNTQFSFVTNQRQWRSYWGEFDYVLSRISYRLDAATGY